MAKRSLIVLIDPKTGEIMLETQGFKGQECIEATKELELALGTVRSMEKTAEYYRDGDERDAWINRTT